MEKMAGIPPAARGIRRDNHVCSVKTCFNLLSPSVPWKMCDTCRAHDRQVRHERRLRDLGELPPLLPRASQKKRKQPTETSTNGAEEGGQNNESVDHTAPPCTSSNAADASLDVPQPDDDISDRIPDGTLGFTEPPTPPPVGVDSNAPSNEELSTALDPSPVAVQNTAPTTLIDGTSSSTTATVRRRTRKSAKQRIGQTSFPAFPTPIPLAYTQQNPALRPPSGGGSYMPPAPPYPPPYYMPHPYGMPPFNSPQAYAHPLSHLLPVLQTSTSHIPSQRLHNLDRTAHIHLIPTALMHRIRIHIYRLASTCHMPTLIHIIWGLIRPRCMGCIIRCPHPGFNYSTLRLSWYPRLRLLLSLSNARKRIRQLHKFRLRVRLYRLVHRLQCPRCRRWLRCHLPSLLSVLFLAHVKDWKPKQHSDLMDQPPMKTTSSSMSHGKTQKVRMKQTHCPHSEGANVTYVIVRLELPSTVVYVNGVEQS
ncbi:hypothetical protein PAXRUDRAFT_276503 [Paxillus rubicundulus Ve08.2h10]|uniref:Uncharacterized protein n=1 Tax=Paxillus rubicundulus Ve08.2h10 TaxID=930991 RepID=A0A0D0C9H5_9AGAM|nr:hypothetical protein PAXRUDRAFT_276503 [Paxillus rubicundulus Ve08.2h10]